MKSRRYRQLAKNPIVRLLRPIFRFFYRLFNPRRSKLRARPDSDLFAEYAEPKLEAPIVKKPPTLGEILDRVEWQFTPGGQVQPTDLKSSSAGVAPPRDSSTVKSRSAAGTAAPQGAAIPNSGVKPTTNTTRLVAAQRNSVRTMTVGELFGSVQWQQRQIKVENSARPPANFDPSRN